MGWFTRGSSPAPKRRRKVDDLVDTGTHRVSRQHAEALVLRDGKERVVRTARGSYRLVKRGGRVVKRPV